MDFLENGELVYCFPLKTWAEVLELDSDIYVEGDQAMYWVRRVDNSEKVILPRRVMATTSQINAKYSQKEELEMESFTIEYDADSKPKDVGLHFDEGKPDLTQITKALADCIGRGMMYGTEKYGRDNFKLFKKGDIVSMYGSLLRHIFKALNGEEFDDESGLSHLDHIASNINIIAFLEDKLGYQFKEGNKNEDN